MPGKIPLYMEPSDDADLALGVEGETTVGLEIEGEGTRAYYIPSCARVTEALRARLEGADLLFFDGTTFEDDEMIRAGLSHKTAWRMGHMAMNGAGGSIAPTRGRRRGAQNLHPHQQFQPGAVPRFARARRMSRRPAGPSPMTGSPSSRGSMIADDAKPRLPRGVRLREDKVRERWVLLAPERVVKVNPIAVEILKLCDGSRTLGEIVDGPRRALQRRSRAGRDATCGRCWPRSPKRGWRSYERNAAAARGPARRTDPSLPARLPLLLQPGRARRAARGDEHGRMEAHLL